MVIFPQEIICMIGKGKIHLIIEFIQRCSFLSFQYSSSKHLHHKVMTKVLTFYCLLIYDHCKCNFLCCTFQNVLVIHNYHNINFLPVLLHSILSDNKLYLML
jgi:hypothetical protein